MNILYLFLKFKEDENELYQTKDSINGDCSIFALKLYDYYSEKGYNPNINVLNKDIHFWINIGSYFIDGRGVFKSQNDIIHCFKKYVVRERIDVISRDNLCKYILKKK